MARPATKAELMEAADCNYKKLMELITSMTKEQLTTPFDFEKDEKKKEAHWRRDRNLRDVLIHLYEWHQLLLHWVEVNQKGDHQPFLPKPYNWKTYGALNEFFWKKHQNTSPENAKKLLDESHRKVMELAELFSNEQLFSKGVYQWVGGTTLGSYFVSNTSSHYNWAIKKLKEHIKHLK